MTLSDSWDTPPSNPNNRRSSVLHFALDFKVCRDYSIPSFFSIYPIQKYNTKILSMRYIPIYALGTQFQIRFPQAANGKTMVHIHFLSLQLTPRILKQFGNCVVSEENTRYILYPISCPNIHCVVFVTGVWKRLTNNALVENLCSPQNVLRNDSPMICSDTFGSHMLPFSNQTSFSSFILSFSLFFLLVPVL